MQHAYKKNELDHCGNWNSIHMTNLRLINQFHRESKDLHIKQPISDEKIASNQIPLKNNNNNNMTCLAKPID